MVRIRHTNGFCRMYGVEFYHNMWVEVNGLENVIRGQPNWEIEGEEANAEPEIEESIDEGDADLESLTKKELQALCDESGVEYKKLDTKATLLSLLQPSDEEE